MSAVAQERTFDRLSVPRESGIARLMKARIAITTTLDGKARVELFDHGDGFYSFEESREVVDDVPELGPMTYWSCSHVSGLYDSRETAEREAQAMIPWLRTRDR